MCVAMFLMNKLTTVSFKFVSFKFVSLSLNLATSHKTLGDKENFAGLRGSSLRFPQALLRSNKA